MTFFCSTEPLLKGAPGPEQEQMEVGECGQPEPELDGGEGKKGAACGQNTVWEPAEAETLKSLCP
jgi:hypothetical protein